MLVALCSVPSVNFREKVKWSEVNCLFNALLCSLDDLFNAVLCSLGEHRLFSKQYEAMFVRGLVREMGDCC